MRPILTPLLLLIITATCRAEFDAGGVQTAKPIATGAAFNSGVAAQKGMSADELENREAQAVGFFPPVRRFVRCRVMFNLSSPTPQPVIKNPSNIPRPKR
jgi:hypothetical protein